MPRGSKWTPLRRAKVDHTLKRKRREKFEGMYRTALVEENEARLVMEALLAAKSVPTTEADAEAS